MMSAGFMQRTQVGRKRKRSWKLCGCFAAPWKSSELEVDAEWLVAGLHQHWRVLLHLHLVSMLSVTVNNLTVGSFHHKTPNQSSNDRAAQLLCALCRPQRKIHICDERV